MLACLYAPPPAGTNGGAARYLLRPEPILWYNGRAQQRREAPVELALRLNVLAVCAAFAFVGAILLGAF
jgi:hypothetical protein